MPELKGRGRHALKEYVGDLFDSGADILVHQTNCAGVMGAGIARQVKERYPEVFRLYKNCCLRLPQDQLIGTTLIVQIGKHQYIANCFGQRQYGRSGRYTEYPALLLHQDGPSWSHRNPSSILFRALKAKIEGGKS